MKLSIIIPAYNESKALPDTLQGLLPLEPQEIIVADGGSSDNTRQIAEQNGVRLIHSPKGRGPQMNAGAEAATGDVFLFLHADTRLMPEGIRKMQHTLADPALAGGAFSLRIDSPHPLLKAVSRVATWRSRFFNLAYGDQAIFVRAEVFRALGGFRPVPICEDLEFFRRLARTGRVVILREKALSSARRWEAEGIVYTTLRNWMVATAFAMGTPPDRLVRWYPPKR